jgi:YhcH/YjgK/YiaL family protein
MLVVPVDHLQKYAYLHPALEKAGAFLAGVGLQALADGRHEIEGHALFAIVSTCAGKGRSGARLEAHRRHIDVQYCLTGSDLIGYRPLAQCGAVAETYDETKDVVFFSDPSLEWISIEGSTCAVFFPDDAHAPLGGGGACKKIVVKIRVQEVPAHRF